jgi:N,N'-diacetyllegionaminate synthase
MKKKPISVDRRLIGDGNPVFVVAEIGINHGGSRELAHKLIDAAADAGADAVKFQTFKADRLWIKSRDRLAQQSAGEETAYDLFRRMELDAEAHASLKKRAQQRSVVFLSTPFDEASVDMLDALGVPAFKVASADINHYPLLRKIASKNKPIFLSTGMSTLAEVSEALLVIGNAGEGGTALLHCVSSYPAPAGSLNLRAIETMRNHFGIPVGYSDHSQGIILPLAAVALGAAILEKHFTLDKQMEGPDHKLSMDPGELKNLIAGIRLIEVGLGNGVKTPSPEERENLSLSRRSLVASCDIRAGQIIEAGMLTCKRPGTGIEPRFLSVLIGTQARLDLPVDTVLQWDHLFLKEGDSNDCGSAPIEASNGAGAAKTS